MADEVLNEGVVETPAVEDLRSTIAAAVEKARGTVEPEAPAPAPGAGADDASAKGERTRDEAGRFARDAKPAEKPRDGNEAPAAKEDQPKAEEPAETSQATTTAVRPPPGWSPASKAAFDTLPQSVKDDIAKREAEVNQGLAKLQDYKGLDRFAEVARNSGTTLEKSLTNFTNWESAIRRDPVGAFIHVAGNLKIQPQQLVQGLIERLGGKPPEGQTQPDPQAAASAIPPALLQEIASIKSAVTAQQKEQADRRQQAVLNDVNAFFEDPKNKYAPNVEDLMVGLINQAVAKGEKIDLKSIYENACWLHPEVRPLLINEQLAASPSASNAAKAGAAAQARAASKAVTGAPTRGIAPGNAPPANESLRDTIRRSVEEQRGA